MIMIIMHYPSLLHFYKGRTKRQTTNELPLVLYQMQFVCSIKTANIYRFTGNQLLNSIYISTTRKAKLNIKYGLVLMWKFTPNGNSLVRVFR